jgi:hypothetical protein
VNSSGAGGTTPRWYQNHELLFALGAVAWLLALVLRWPTALSFSDEIGYLGQAKLLLEGRFRPITGSPGIWNQTPTGAVAQYPFLVPLLLIPLFAISPSAIFLVGVLPALALAWVASRILKSWGHSPCWGLIFLAHPTVVILARTAMSDVLLAALALAAWWSLRNRRAVPTILLLAATMAARPTGIPIAVAIIAGEVFETGRRSSRALAVAQAKMGILGFVLGTILVLTSNELATGTILFGYSFRPGLPSFRPSYILKTAPMYVRALLFNPPLLFLGLITYWRRRLVAPLLVISGFGAMMSFYVWVDWAPTWLETLVLSERLILPIVTFLLIGYVAGLSQITTRLGLAGVATGILVIAPAAIAFQIGARHHIWQQPMRKAREAATTLARQIGSNELGLTYGSSKAGLLFPGKTRWIVSEGPRPPVLLCATHGNSYRTLAAGNLEEDRCDATGYPGYHEVRSLDGFMLMLRDGVDGLPAAPGPESRVPGRRGRDGPQPGATID